MAKNVGEKFVETLAAAGVKGVDGVVGDSLSGLTDALKQVVWIFAVVCSVVLPAHAQQTDELQKQLQQLKQQYEQTTRELQERIAALEQQIKKEREAKQHTPRKEGAVSAAELAVQEAKKAALGGSNQNEQTLQGQLPSAPTYELLRLFANCCKRPQNVVVTNPAF